VTPLTLINVLRRIDVGAGTVLVERALDLRPAELLYDRGSNRVIAFGSRTVSFDAGTLTEVARIDEAFSKFALDPDLPHLYVVKGRQIQQRDSRSLALLAERDRARRLQCGDPREGTVRPPRQPQHRREGALVRRSSRSCQASEGGCRGLRDERSAGSG
jgi:hypothetical protein